MRPRSVPSPWILVCFFIGVLFLLDFRAKASKERKKERGGKAASLRPVPLGAQSRAQGSGLTAAHLSSGIGSVRLFFLCLPGRSGQTGRPLGPPSLKVGPGPSHRVGATGPHSAHLYRPRRGPAPPPLTSRLCTSGCRVRPGQLPSCAVAPPHAGDAPSGQSPNPSAAYFQGRHFVRRSRRVDLVNPARGADLSRHFLLLVCVSAVASFCCVFSRGSRSSPPEPDFTHAHHQGRHFVR
ncbi:hypothetical protein NDU88_002831 [Pleurodeles waltl]|uniref:Uncharacterized protein n=1 Tax=Pleurodeles waltl TaxID=8319 RepID=A0AAV7VBP3_PLEWA|nr:hypothetical protein NDU88_002831 [Pleurodeles waltl]